MEYAIGVDVRLNFLKVAMYDIRGHYLHFWEQHCDSCGPEAVISGIAAGLNHLVEFRKAAMDDVRGIGVTLDGEVDFQKGVIKEAQVLNWRAVNLREQAESLLGKPVMPDNQINCRALAEMWQGAGWGKKDLVFVDCSRNIEMRVIRNRTLDRQFPDQLAAKVQPFNPAEPLETLRPLLQQALNIVNPEAIIVNGVREQDDHDFWNSINRSWQSFAGPTAPLLFPAELGEDALTCGAAALVMFG